MTQIEAKPLTVTVETALRLTGLGRTKLYELINDQRLKSILIGKRRLVIFSSIEELLDVPQR